MNYIEYIIFFVIIIALLFVSFYLYDSYIKNYMGVGLDEANDDSNSMRTDTNVDKDGILSSDGISEDKESYGNPLK